MMQPSVPARNVPPITEMITTRAINVPALQCSTKQNYFFHFINPANRNSCFLEEIRSCGTQSQDEN
jgi:hypothetical protein